MSDQKPNVGFSMAQWEKTTVEERDKTTCVTGTVLLTNIIVSTEPSL